MKKIVLLAVVIAATSFASCKKDYKCECTRTMTSTSTNGVSGTVSNATTVSTREISKTGKKTATAMCGNSTDVTTSTTTVGGTDYVTTTNYASTCSLK